MGSDIGNYCVPDSEYDTFLTLVNSSIFGPHRRASSLLEKHRENGPLLVDLDFKYASEERALERRFTEEQITEFVIELVSALGRFVDLSKLPHDLSFYILEKPAPEVADRDKHKDGVHIQCPNLTTDPQLQFAIRGYLLEQGVIERIFGPTAIINDPTDCYDVSVIHQNNWFLYGACKPNKQQYKITSILSVLVAQFKEIPEYVELEMEEIPTNTLELMKRLSIRVGHTVPTPLVMRSATAAEYKKLLTTWGQGKANPLRVAPLRTAPVSATLRHDAEDDDAPSHEAGSDGGSETMTGPPTSEDEIKFAYRLVKECLDPETRCGDYHDWIKLAICLKNISNTEESFLAWCEITRRVDPSHKKASFTDAELKAKWNKVTAANHEKPVRIASLQYWAKDDNPDAFDAILSENIRDWIMANASDAHVDIAHLMHKLYKHEFICTFSPKAKHDWYRYVGHCWELLKSPIDFRKLLSDTTGLWGQYQKVDHHLSTILLTCKEADREGWEGKRKFIRNIQKKLKMNSFKNSVFNECQELFYDEKFILKLNMNSNLIGAANGVLELRHWDNPEKDARAHVLFRPGRPEDYITNQMGRSEDLEPISYEPYDPTAPTAVHKAIFSFYEKLYPDPVLRTYVLTLDASCLLGENVEQRFYIEQGGGSNGKSMKQTLKRHTFGDYATSLQTTALTRKRPDSGAANPDMIVLKAKRYIYGGEPDNGEKINSARMKQLSGEDMVEARGLYGDQEKFKLMGKIFIACNDLPQISAMDNGTWRRIRIIPHVSKFVPADIPEDPEKFVYHRDNHLSEKMKQVSWRTAYFGILVYYFETQYLEHGLIEPDCVKAASEKYRIENDTFSGFAAEHLVVEAGAGPIRLIDVWNRYKDWKKSMPGMAEMKKATVGDRMKLIAAHGSSDTEFVGVRFKEDGEES
jgi:P4 family phage/plasmid primase-like protien